MWGQLGKKITFFGGVALLCLFTACGGGGDDPLPLPKNDEKTSDLSELLAKLDNDAKAIQEIADNSSKSNDLGDLLSQLQSFQDKLPQRKTEWDLISNRLCQPSSPEHVQGLTPEKCEQKFIHHVYQLGLNAVGGFAKASPATQIGAAIAGLRQFRSLNIPPPPQLIASVEAGFNQLISQYPGIAGGFGLGGLGGNPLAGGASGFGFFENSPDPTANSTSIFSNSTANTGFGNIFGGGQSNLLGNSGTGTGSLFSGTGGTNTTGSFADIFGPDFRAVYGGIRTQNTLRKPKTVREKASKMKPFHDKFKALLNSNNL